ncbi:MAG: PAS domain-containing protein [Alphaproteobacteria bacterium]|nr:PAS domain-containing protein [Alphaproteobacteria bacterium]
MESDFGRVIDALPGLVWTTRPDGYCDFLNRRWFDYTGLSWEQAIGWGWESVLHPDDRSGMLAYWQTCLASGTGGEIEGRLRRADGVYRWFHFRLSPVTDAEGRIIKWCGLNTEIDDLKRVEEKSRTLERRFRSIIEGLPAMVTLMTPAGEFAYGNQYMIDYFGAPFEELKARPTTESFHPEDRLEVDRRWKHSIDTGEPYDYEARLKGGDAVYRWFHTRGFPLRDPDGKIALWYLLQENIDDRRRADEELRASERNARAIVDGFPGLVAVFSADGFMEQVNQQVVAFWGKSPEALKDWTSADVLHPEDVPLKLNAFAKAFAARSSFEVEVRGRRFDGAYRWLLSRGIPVKDDDGRIVRWYNLLIDIDDRKRAEEALAASKRNLQLIIDTTPALIWSARPDGNTESVNQHFLDYLGRTLEEMQAWVWADAIHPDDQDGLAAVWSTLQQTGEAGQFEARLRRHDGEYRWFLLRANPLRDESGAIVKWYGVNTDIEDRKRAEEALRAREREQKRIIDTTPALIWSPDAKGRIEWVNQHYIDYVGLPLEQMPRQGWEIIHPDDVERLTETWKTLFSSGKTGETEARLRRHDGQYRWFLFRASPMRDENGTIVKWYGVNTDIEDRKRAEATVRLSERNLQHTIDATPALIWSTDPSGATDAFNQHYLDFVGRPAEELLGWGWAVTIHPDDQEHLTTFWKNLLAAGEPGQAEARLLRHDGTYRWFIMRANPMRDESGAIVKWYGVNTDIEDRKHTEQELSRSEAFLSQGESVSETGSFLWRLSTNEITWSQQLYRIFGFEPGSLVTLERIAALVHPEDLPRMDDMVARARMGRDSEYEHRLLLPDGTVKYLHFVARATRDQEGALEYIGVVQDVTERRLAEQALSKVRSELAHVARVSSLGALTASIAHEVNQPLAGIVTNASTCLRMLAADQPNIEGARETARRTIRDGNRAAEVITRLRALFAKKEASVESIDLNDAAREVIALSVNELQRGRVVLRQEFADDLPSISGDRVQLQQVVLNLILNATDAMSDVGDRLRLLTIKTELDEDEQVRLSVRDSGVGIDPQTASKMFDAFHTTKPGGMGIGLSVSRSIIDRHQGRLWARSNDGPGATFSFSIPRGELRADPAAFRSTATDAAQGTSPH